MLEVKITEDGTVERLHASGNLAELTARAALVVGMIYGNLTNPIVKAMFRSHITQLINGSDSPLWYYRRKQPVEDGEIGVEIKFPLFEVDGNEDS